MMQRCTNKYAFFPAIHREVKLDLANQRAGQTTKNHTYILCLMILEIFEVPSAGASLLLVGMAALENAFSPT